MCNFRVETRSNYAVILLSTVLDIVNFTTWYNILYDIHETHRSICSLLASVFSSSTFEIHVDRVYDVEEVLDDGHFSIHGVLARRVLKQ